MNQLNLSLRPHHRQLLDYIRHYAPVTRAELSRITGLTPGAITQQCRELIFSGLIIEGERITGQRGQPSLPISLNPLGGYAFGVAFAHDHMDVTVVDLAGNVLWRKTEMHEANQSLHSAITQLKSMMLTVLNEKSIDKNRVLGMGIALPGYIQKDGHCRPTVNWLSDWCDCKLTEQFRLALDIPIWIEHNANTAAIGEYYSGNWQKIRNLITLDFSYGLSAGIVIEGKLLRGAFGNAGEISSSMTLSQPCLVSLLAENAIDYADAERLIKASHPVIESWILLHLERVKAYIFDALHWLDPELVVLTGTLPKSLLERLAAIINQNFVATTDTAQPSLQINAKVVCTKTSVENSALGAALLPLYQVLSHS